MQVEMIVMLKDPGWKRGRSEQKWRGIVDACEYKQQSQAFQF